MNQLREKYEDLSATKQKLVRNKWKVDFKVSSKATFYNRLDSPTPEDLKYFAVVFNCSVDDLINPTEVTKKARPLDDLLKDESKKKIALEYGLVK